MNGTAARRGTGVGLEYAQDTQTLFAQTMWLVAVTTGLFAFGAYVGRDLSTGWGLVFFVAAFACLIGMKFAVRASSSPAVALLLLFGFLIGLGTAPTIAYYAGAGPEVVWEAGGATALFMTGLGAAGYATRRDLSGIARASFWALLALIIFGIVTIFAQYNERFAHLLRPWAGDLRRPDHGRLPEAAHDNRYGFGTAHGGVDLP
jgi:modulator of FtsH protease